MRRSNRLGRRAGAVLAAGLMVVLAGCGQLFSASGQSSQAQPTLQSLAQRVTQLEATVSELQAAVAGGGGTGGASAATSSGSGTAASAVVTASYLNVRRSPSVSATRIGVLKHDTLVSVLAQSGDWSQVHFGSVTGWVDSQWLANPSSGAALGGSATGTTGARGRSTTPTTPSTPGTPSTPSPATSTGTSSGH